MRDETRLYHNRLECSKCQGALLLLQARSIEPTLVDLRACPPTTGELAELVALLALPARALLRVTEPEYFALGLDDPALPDARLLEAMAAHPQLIERPIFVHGGRAVIGRPPERVLELM